MPEGVLTSVTVGLCHAYRYFVGQKYYGCHKVSHAQYRQYQRIVL